MGRQARPRLFVIALAARAFLALRASVAGKRRAPSKSSSMAGIPTSPIPACTSPLMPCHLPGRARGRQAARAVQERCVAAAEKERFQRLRYV